MKTGRFIFIPAVLLILSVLPSCYESPGITYHQPGEYKGKSDPLPAKERNPGRQDILVERFNKVQTDR